LRWWWLERGAQKVKERHAHASANEGSDDVVADARLPLRRARCSPKERRLVRRWS